MSVETDTSIVNGIKYPNMDKISPHDPQQDQKHADTRSPAKSLQIEWTPTLENYFQRACIRYKFDFEKVSKAMRKAYSRILGVDSKVDLIDVTPTLCRKHWAMLEKDGKALIGEQGMERLFSTRYVSDGLVVHDAPKVATLSTVSQPEQSSDVGSLDRDQAAQNHLLEQDMYRSNPAFAELYDLDNESTHSDMDDTFNICTSQTIEDLYNECQAQIADRFANLTNSGMSKSASLPTDFADVETLERGGSPRPASIDPSLPRTPASPRPAEKDKSVEEEVPEWEDAAKGFFGFDGVGLGHPYAAQFQRFMEAEAHAEQVKRERQERLFQQQQEARTRPVSATVASRMSPGPRLASGLSTSTTSISGDSSVEDLNALSDLEISKRTYETMSRNLRQVLAIAHILNYEDERPSYCYDNDDDNVDADTSAAAGASSTTANASRDPHE